MEQNVLITGASNGIGRELALQYACMKYKVIAVARNEQELLELERLHPEYIIGVKFDLSEFAKYDALKREIEKHVTYIDVLINNAGRLINKPFQQMTVLDFDEVIDVNYKAPYFLTQLLLDLIEKSNKKAIINIGSMGGVDNTDKFPGLSIYSSSKGAISTLTECLATEIASTGCTINCLALGAVQTDMLKQAFPDYVPDITPVKMAKFIIAFIESNHQLMNGKVVQAAGVSV